MGRALSAGSALDLTLTSFIKIKFRFNVWQGYALCRGQDDACHVVRGALLGQNVCGTVHNLACR